MMTTRSQTMSPVKEWRCCWMCQCNLWFANQQLDLRSTQKMNRNIRKLSSSSPSCSISNPAEPSNTAEYPADTLDITLYATISCPEVLTILKLSGAVYPLLGISSLNK